eukprot:85287_1
MRHAVSKLIRLTTKTSLRRLSSVARYKHKTTVDTCTLNGTNKTYKKVQHISSVLLLSNSFNSMTQRFWMHLVDQGYNVHFESVDNEQDISDIYSQKVIKKDDINTFNFDVIFCPFLTKKIPNELFTNNTNNKKPKILIVHPGIAGDRGISSIDWTLLDPYNSNNGDGNYWGCTILEAHEEMDCGDIWSTKTFDMLRPNTNYKFTKSNLYQKEMIDTAVKCLDETLYKLKHNIKPDPLNYDNHNIKGKLRPTMKPVDRRFEWSWGAEKINKHINASSSRPGILCTINNEEYFVYDSFIEDFYEPPLNNYEPGTVLGTKNDSVLISTGSKPIWISTLKKKGKNNIKLPAAHVLDDMELIPNISCGFSYNDIYYKIRHNIVYLYFDFFNGAFDTNKCIRLQAILNEIASLPQDIIVLMGGYQYFGNGINLNTIENATNDELESFRNITAINNIIQTIFTSFSNKLLISAIHGNCGAGGCMLSLVSDIIWTHKNVTFNPHYKLMNLYGSEYHSEFLINRIGAKNATQLMDLALPINAKWALNLGLIDDIIGENSEDFRHKLIKKLTELNQTKSFLNILKSKYKLKRDLNWIAKAENHRNNEMSKMFENFQNKQYKQNRHNFVQKIYTKRIITNEEAQNLLSIIYNNTNKLNNNIEFNSNSNYFETNILYGKELANKTQKELKKHVIEFENNYHRVPKLAIICVGFDDNLDLYTRNKIRAANKIGMEAELVRLGENIHVSQLENIIYELNNDNFTDGIILQLPIPEHLNCDLNKIINLISPYKDVDGLTMYSHDKLKNDARNNNLYQLTQQLDIENYHLHYLNNNYINIPCVPFGIIQSIYSFDSLYNFNDSLSGKHALIIGNSEIVGKPMSEILLGKNMTVTKAHKYTKHLSDLTCSADLIITATGVPKLLKKEWIKNGSVIFDVGIAYNKNTNELCGDVDFDDVMRYVHAITPVPGGIGPLTVSAVLSNTINSAKWRQNYHMVNNNNQTQEEIICVFDMQNNCYQKDVCQSLH